MTNTFKPEVNSPQWVSFIQWLEGELVDSHLRLAALGITTEDAQQRRGAIALINRILALETHAGVIKTAKLNGR